MSMETEMFGPHDVTAGHEHSLEVSAAVMAAAVDLAKAESVDLPVYYTVIGLMRAAAKLGVFGLGDLSGAMEPMFRMMLEQEAKRLTENAPVMQ